MSNLEPRRRSGLNRNQREHRAYSLVLATGGLTLLAVALVVLAALNVIGLGPAIIIALLAAGTGFMLKRTLSP